MKKIAMLILCNIAILLLVACSYDEIEKTMNTITPETIIETESTKDYNEIDELKNDMAEIEEIANEETVSQEITDEEASNEESTLSNETSTDSFEQLVDGMRPSFKEAMDSYEAFYDEYCNFMENYKNNPSDLNLLTQYSEIIIKMTEMDEKFEAWDEDEMNETELKYYLEVSERITKKLLEVAQ